MSGTTQTFVPLRSPDSGKIVSAEEAVRLIRAGDTIATGGFVGIGFAEEIAVSLESFYLSKREEHSNDTNEADGFFSSDDLATVRRPRRYAPFIAW